MHLAGSKEWPHLKVYSRVESYIHTHAKEMVHVPLKSNRIRWAPRLFFFLSRAQRLHWSYY